MESDLAEQNGNTTLSPDTTDQPSTSLSDQLTMDTTTDGETGQEMDQLSDVPDSFENTIGFALDGGNATITISGEGVQPTGLSLNQQMTSNNEFQISIEATFSLDGSLVSSTARPQTGTDPSQSTIPEVPGETTTEDTTTGTRGGLSLTVSPSHAMPGDQVTLSGSGFTSNESINITFDGETLEGAESITADTNGSFTTSVSVPEDASGVISMFVATDESGNRAQALLTKAEAPTETGTPQEPSLDEALTTPEQPAAPEDETSEFGLPSESIEGEGLGELTAGETGTEDESPPTPEEATPPELRPPSEASPPTQPDNLSPTEPEESGTMSTPEEPESDEDENDDTTTTNETDDMENES